MSANLMITTAVDTYSANRAALVAIAPDAQVATDDAAVRAIAQLLEGVRLDDGQFAYPMDEDDQMSSEVFAFGPSLLAPAKLKELRALVAERIPAAAALLDEVIDRNLQIAFRGSQSWHGAYVRADANAADDVEVNYCVSTLKGMFDDLGLGDYNPPKGEQSVSKDVPFEEFVAAVDERGRDIEHRIQPRLKAFIEMGRRRGAVTVYFA
jgi:hypothetical protein